MSEGLYGYNALLTGMAITFDWGPGIFFVPVLLLAAIGSLLATVLANLVFSKWSLPSLSIPFVLTVWVFTIFLRQSNLLPPQIHDPYFFNESMLGYSTIHNPFPFKIPENVSVILSTFSGVFFIRSPLAGIIIAIGMLIWSRIAFVFSSIVLLSAYFMFNTSLGPAAWLSYQCGSNYIFLALGVGTFYAVPSKGSLIAALVLIPFTLIAHVFLSRVGALFFLPIYTLAFTAATHLFLATIHVWGRKSWIVPIEIQNYSPEAAVYRTSFFAERLKNIGKVHFRLPILGEWMVSQGYNGSFTHKGNWSSALDFIILDDEMKGFGGKGMRVTDFYCYNKPVLAPAAGWVVESQNHIDDNAIAGMDIRQNWGNGVVLNHGNGIFSQLSHLKKESLKVQIGQYVKAGDIIGNCGSSGRSPEPHLHFQIQKEEKTGSPTLAYPLAYFMAKNSLGWQLKEFTVPVEGQFVSNVETDSALVSAFDLLPGHKLNFEADDKEEAQWEVFTDAWNRAYIYCHTSGSYAYFVNDGTMFYFTDFDGSKSSLLYLFYLSAYKILLATYPALNLSDRFSLQYVYMPIARVLQDIAAPFLTITKAEYRLKYPEQTNALDKKAILLRAEMAISIWGSKLSSRKMEIVIEDGQIKSISGKTKKGEKKWERV